MSRLPHPHSAHGRIEHFQDFTSLDWCQDLLSDPSMTRIQKRHVPDQREDISNTFFTKTLFTDEALRAYISMYRPGRIGRDHDEKTVSTGSASMGSGGAGHIRAEGAEPSLLSKEEYIWSATDPDTPEMYLLISIGHDMDGGVQRLHGGVTATLLDQVMGTLISYVYDSTCPTADLNIKYKAAVNTPCVLLCRAKVVRKMGRWIESVGWIEDGQGKVFAEGKGAFVMNKNTLAAAAKI
ncbi:HotDog domain-containing protein [Boeremia exigua]|uniref:HotDog domain-containing protein n=1 Tax=Boeremia exigua TaxID=749465 RepID=UPI001E8DE073|nr:HotDog domain-containing protein [Boeremia exigua]KAH6639576.1 HotDog domain-containing protein [Boeremia exigua]